jgi:hypothetical protein
VPGDSDELVLYQGEATYLYATSNWVDVRNSGLAQNIPYDAQASDILLLNLVNGANLNVAVGDMGQAMTLEELEFSILGEYRNLGLAVIDIQPVELLDGTGLRAEALLRQSAQESLTLLQYSIMQDTTLYVLTFTTGARFFSQLQPEFDSIGLTLGIGEAPSEDD